MLIKRIKITVLMLIAVLSVVIFWFSKTVSAQSAGNTSGYAWSEQAGWISFNCDQSLAGGQNTCGSVDYGVLVGDSSLSGYAWSEVLGWISFNCDQSLAGGQNTCGSVDYKVENQDGALSGYAWSEQAGWISFKDNSDSALYQVSIDSQTGVFSGYAWSEALGWISFNCADTGTCGIIDYSVKTAWRGTLGQLATPGNVSHTSNQTNSINWVWDAVLNATGYEIYLEEFGVYNPVGVSNSASFTLDTLSDGTTVLSANTKYFIKVKAIDSSGNYNDSALSMAVGAYTSALNPQNLQVDASLENAIDWSWSSGGAEAGFFAQIKENTSVNSGWLSSDILAWQASDLNCNTNYTLQIKAKNEDGDETAWQEKTGSTSACPASCTSAGDCPTGNICVAGACRLSNQCNPLGASCSKVFNGFTLSGKCITGNKCNVPPLAYITKIQEGNTETAFKFTGQNSLDDFTDVADLKARWDFEYNGTTPNWDINYNGIRATSEVSYLYSDSGSYTVLLQLRDGNNLDSDLDQINTILPIEVGGSKLAIDPETYPAQNQNLEYYFGVLRPGESKTINMRVCNLGVVNLDLESISITGPNSDDFSHTAPAEAFTLNTDPNPIACSPDLDHQARLEMSITFTAPATSGMITSSATLAIQGTEQSINLALKGVSKKPPVLIFDQGQPTENIIYDSRIIFNEDYAEFVDDAKVSNRSAPR